MKVWKEKNSKIKSVSNLEKKNEKTVDRIKNKKKIKI